MPLVGPAVKAAMKAAIQAGLAREFGDVSSTSGYAGISAQQWEKLADAISDVGLVMVLQIQANAQVAPGIPTAGGPTNQATVAPGKIL
jgi:hypothetical protein